MRGPCCFLPNELSDRILAPAEIRHIRNRAGMPRWIRSLSFCGLGSPRSLEIEFLRFPTFGTAPDWAVIQESVLDRAPRSRGAR